MLTHLTSIGTLALMLTTAPSGSSGEPEDTHQWLEDVTGAKPLAWVKERNAESTRELIGSPLFRALDRRILEILDSDERIPSIQKLGAYYYNFWRDATNPARPLEAHHARRVQEGQAKLGGGARS